VLATIHRAENTDNPAVLKEIVEALNAIHAIVPVVIPIHPRTLNKLHQHHLKLHCHTFEPVGYLEMLYLLNNATLVMTDSGGLQKEAYYFAKPCITLRTETEWVELVEHGVNMLAPLSKDGILSSFQIMRNIKLTMDHDLYGSGKAAEKIVSYLLTHRSS